MLVPLERILSDTDFRTHDDIEDLVEDIKKRGLQHPIIVHTIPDEGFDYGIVCGYRRYEAYRLLGYHSIPVKITKEI